MSSVFPGGDVAVDSFEVDPTLEELWGAPEADGAGAVDVKVTDAIPGAVLMLGCPPAKDGDLRLTETLDNPPPPRGTQPPELSSLVITCALTLTR